MPAQIIPLRRERNGRLQRPTMAQIKAAEAARLMEEKQTVLAQPHRRGDIDQRRESELGRFVMENRLRGELYLAGNQLFVLVWSWRAAIGCPMPLRIPKASLMAVDPDHPGQDRAWLKKINRCYKAIQKNCGPGAVPSVVNLCVEGGAVAPANRLLVIQGLAALAVELGTVQKQGFVPFLSPQPPAGP